MVRAFSPAKPLVSLTWGVASGLEFLHYHAAVVRPLQVVTQRILDIPVRAEFAEHGSVRCAYSSASGQALEVAGTCNGFNRSQEL